MVEGINSGHVCQWHGSHLYHVITWPKLAREGSWHACVVAKLAFSETIHAVANLQTTDSGAYRSDDARIFEERLFPSKRPDQWSKSLQFTPIAATATSMKPGGSGCKSSL